jgi:hypothetical protein
MSVFLQCTLRKVNETVNFVVYIPVFVHPVGPDCEPSVLMPLLL